ncbi:MAG: hypothetical protein JW882_22210 [Deltaproteobacteria bacterium]|nr:hypothetical protein [Deltaproteobacteria bacterium]
MPAHHTNKTNIGHGIELIMKGIKPDRPLVWYWGAVPAFAVKDAGYGAEVAYNDPERAFLAQTRAIEIYDIDNIPIIAVGGASDLTWAFGGKIKWPSGRYEMAPVPVHYPVADERGAKILSVPEDIDSTGPIPLYRDFSDLQKLHGLPVTIFITSPLEGARSLCGPEKLMRWMIKRPDLFARLMAIATEYSIRIARLWARRYDPRRIMVYLTAPTSSSQMISPVQFEKFVFPFQKELHEKILDAGINTIFCHICGDHNLNMPYWARIPMGENGIVSIGHEVDISRAVEYFGQKSVIAGNIEPAAILQSSPEEVYHLCIAALEKGGKARRGHILMPGCGLPPQVKSKNLHMLKKAVTEYFT